MNQRLGQVKGFTLIELLIVVSIIGILSGLLIPNLLTAIAKTRCKTNMREMSVISTAISDYVLDNGYAPISPSGSYTTSSVFYTSLAPFYIKILPLTDRFGNPYQAYCGVMCDGVYGLTDNNMDDFVIASLGMGGELEGWTFSPTVPEDGLFIINSINDFRKDLIIWSGVFIRAPRQAAVPIS